MGSADASRIRGPDTPGAGNIVLRAISAVLGGYLFVYALTAVASLAFFHAGMSRVDAADLSTNLALLTYPAIAIWAFGRRSLLEAAGAPLLLAAILIFVAFLIRL